MWIILQLQENTDVHTTYFSAWESLLLLSVEFFLFFSMAFYGKVAKTGHCIKDEAIRLSYSIRIFTFPLFELIGSPSRPKRFMFLCWIYVTCLDEAMTIPFFHSFFFCHTSLFNTIYPLFSPIFCLSYCCPIQAMPIICLYQNNSSHIIQERHSSMSFMLISK